MNIQYVRLDDEICEIVNRMAEEQGRKVSEIVNEILRSNVEKQSSVPSNGDSATRQRVG
jgi:hypothetical protein